MKTIFKRTKILATIGPSVFSQEAIEELVKAGVNGCRLNCSHGTNEERDEHIRWIREVSKKLDKPVAILQDLQGPKIRLGDVKNNHLEVHAGDELILDYALRDQEHDGGMTVPVQYNLAEKVKVGEPVYIWDGKVRTKVTEIVSDTAIKIKIENDGEIARKKGLNLPDTDFEGDILTPKDMTDIEYGVTQDFDYIALSFVQSADDIEKFRQVLLSYGRDIPIIAKIETKQAVANDEIMEAIVEATDGVMIARGDMAYEAGMEIVPIVQRKLISLCRKHGKLCIVATQTMASMVDSPVPTRAEANDIATAVIQGADAVMLSEESAMGKYPIETVQAMKKVILYTQEHAAVESIDDLVRSEHKALDAISEAAVDLAGRLKADAIVCETKTGVTSTTVAANRPNMRIISVTDSARTAQQLTLSYANKSYIRPYSDTYGVDLIKELKADGSFGSKEEVEVVVVSGHHHGRVGGSDTIQYVVV